MTEQRDKRNVGDEVRDGIKAGLGILSAVKDAIEETIEDMMERGELSPERAREAVRTTMDRAQSAFDEARDRLDVVPRREFEALKAEVHELRGRIDAMSGVSGNPPSPPADTPSPGGGGGPGAGGPGAGGPGAGSSRGAGDIPVSEG